MENKIGSIDEIKQEMLIENIILQIMSHFSDFKTKVYGEERMRTYAQDEIIEKIVDDICDKYNISVNKMFECYEKATK